MPVFEKRRLLVGAASAVAATGLMARMPGALAQNPREQMRHKHFPNLSLVTHEGKDVRFYDHVLRDRKVVINFTYTVCSNICAPVTQNILEAQRLLGNLAKEIDFYSISLTPLDDDPAVLRAYMKVNHIGKGWTFLTGKPENIEQIRRGLGFAQRTLEADADISNHSGMLRIGNERLVSWGHASATTTGKAIARMIRFELS